MTPVVILNTSNASSIVKSVSSGIGAGFIPVSNMVLDPISYIFVYTFSLPHPLYGLSKKIEKDTAFQRLSELSREYADRWTDMDPEIGDLVPYA